MRAIRLVVDGQNFVCPAALRRFPSGGERVVVHHQPIPGCALSERRRAVIGVHTRIRKPVERMAARVDQLAQMSGQAPTEEVRLRARCPQGIGQGQAAHDMAGTNLDGSIGTEGDFHVRKARRHQAMGTKGGKVNPSSLAARFNA